MNDDVKIKKNEWFMAVIRDPFDLAGQSVFEILSIIKKLMDPHFVLISDLEGAGITTLNSKEPILFNDEFLKNILSVKQFDWADFFLFNDFPVFWQTLAGKTYAEIISLTSTTIRAVDDTYIYIYTPSDTLVKLIKDNYLVEEIKKGMLVDLDYPF